MIQVSKPIFELSYSQNLEIMHKSLHIQICTALLKRAIQSFKTPLSLKYGISENNNIKKSLTMLVKTTERSVEVVDVLRVTYFKHNPLEALHSMQQPHYAAPTLRSTHSKKHPP